MIRAARIPVILLAGVILFAAVACNPSRKYEKEEQEMIDSYLRDNPNLTFEQKASGLYIYNVTVGTGGFPVKDDTVYVKYTGKFLNGTIFDTNVGTADSLVFPVLAGWLIEGFDEGVTYMKTGGKSILLIPSWLAYGTSGLYGFVSGYTPLIFDLELVKIKKGPGK
ncbi:MAG: FKBP-type peptidyl-prolyl cis-trans isomerase [Bacteroidales bacterium]|jgi:FKBP-type peptidyl-prolyl cis-trans isomerase|nr:FKBP-type peptidyl-prolyl cis-trans isomerase [Bacteroidales bacterium]MCU0408068.1 FKBP-type peptidyl-prolyl cis-trans isomerase [Bacteroidales bacterium]